MCENPSNGREAFPSASVGVVVRVSPNTSRLSKGKLSLSAVSLFGVIRDDFDRPTATMGGKAFEERNELGMESNRISM